MFVLTCCSPEMTGVDLLAVGGVAAGKDSFAKGVGEG